MQFKLSDRTMELKGAIFDLDGTLLSSMHIWDTLGIRFLLSKNMIPESGLREKMTKMGMRASSVYLSSEYDLGMTADEVYHALISLLEEQYFHLLKLKPFAKEFIFKLKENDVKLAIVTATDRHLSEAVVIRTGIRECFDVFITTKEFGSGKSQPDIFYRACEMLECEKESILVFEDATYALRTAHDNGFNTAAVYDFNSNCIVEENKRMADFYIQSYYDAMTVFDA